MTRFYAQEASQKAYEKGFKEGIAHGQHLRDSERQSQADRIKELEADNKELRAEVQEYMNLGPRI